MTEPEVAIARRQLLTELLRGAGEIGPRDRVQACDQLEGGWSRFSHIATVGDADGSERRCRTDCPTT